MSSFVTHWRYRDEKWSLLLKQLLLNGADRQVNQNLPQWEKCCSRGVWGVLR